MKKCFVCGSEDSVIDFDKKSFKKCFLKLLFSEKKTLRTVRLDYAWIRLIILVIILLSIKK